MFPKIIYRPFYFLYSLESFLKTSGRETTLFYFSLIEPGLSDLFTPFTLDLQRISLCLGNKLDWRVRMSVSQPYPPLPSLEAAVFLDFDGTLVDLACTPCSVVLPRELVSMLHALQILLDGAVAIVTGREVAVIDRYIEPLSLPCAGTHGAQRRNGKGVYITSPVRELTKFIHAGMQLAQANPAIFVEPKNHSIALHYRTDPTLETLCLQTMQQLLFDSPDWVLVRGKYVVELLPRGVSKGAAINAFMEELPFKGRIPFFAGDDLSDEDGFVAIQELQGIAIKVGAGTSIAAYRIDSVRDFHRWLHKACAQLQAMQRGK